MIDSHDVFQKLINSARLVLVESHINKKYLCGYFRDYLKETTTPTVCIIGGSGSGKSTLAADMSKCLKAELLKEEGYHIHDRKWRRKTLYKTKNPNLIIDYKDFKYDVRTLIKEPSSVLSLPKYNSLNGTVTWEEFRKNHINGLIVEGVNKKTLNLYKYDLTIYLHTSDTERYLTRIKRGGRSDRLLSGENLLQEFLKRQDIEHIPSTLPCINRTNFVLYRRADSISWKFTYDLYKMC